MLFGIRNSALLALATLLATVAPPADAVTLTYWVGANEKACFYTNVNEAGKKLGFYFAGQAGGNFDIDFTVTNPRDQVILSDEAQKQGDYVLTGNLPGEYAFCFSNGVATREDKLIDFDISVEDESRAKHTPDHEKAGEDDKVDESLHLIGAGLARVERDLKYFRTRENRNKSTVQSTQERVFYFAVMESVAIFAVAALQVFAIRTLFNTKKTRF
ncbi:hypothetical protein H4R33_003432 [Dimargaris cristalligena]|uniref:Emp24/gp25L/p24 family/GOLD-domain-containing protein n=1 Tax=Dimargaris cristalligena TaxID=215637 RepID=A0A4P9ZXT0_9FUNG|nr:hypothetical protein H4R33_003432 [Dimargaris cristalligena]RKP37722.1 emp24/gp25L/p24 family/GOLD-domain-containing protein [Dimargaris cristalligena]|eukprot:RKP37722.1 emp24/gp25L/p24 family/GOLD-domain-containing protein [Dimargaris cristalligena]